MKVLHLMRHADASHPAPGTSDRNRELGPRGRREAREAGGRLMEWLDPLPVYCSAALRTRQTLAELCTAWPALAGESHAIEEGLYTFSASDLITWLASRPDDRDKLFLLGHNPGLTDLVNHLVPDAGLSHLPTAGYVQLHLAIDTWASLPKARGKVALGLFPESR
ncbi:SixA phosphatase family protein [Haliea atlantica]